MEASSQNAGMVLCLALSYGGRETIARAARRLCEEVAEGRLAAERVDVEFFGSRLPSGKLPALDLLIRTSGERRVSNFFLWEIAYAELHFTDTLWPDFGRADLVAAIQDFASRERRFGLLPDQVATRLAAK
jgi:undecaprenyl diphosphate synthase